MHLLAQPPLGADAHAIANDQHPDHQLRIDRWPTRIAIEWAQMLAQITEVAEPIDRPKEMIRGHMILDAEAVKQSFLRHGPLAHHQHLSR